MEFLRHRRAADHAAAFQHSHLQAGARQIEGADEPVMARAYDQDITMFGQDDPPKLPARRIIGDGGI